MSSAPSKGSADAVSHALETAADRIVESVLAVGVANPVVLIDGRSGSGKTTLARRLVQHWPWHGRVQSVALDSIYPGWDGLAAGAETARELILRPHARGLVGVWQRWDWDAAHYAEAHAMDPSLPLIVEGAGVLTAASAGLGDVRVWLESPPHTRKQRALLRDGATYRPHWVRWAEQEERHLAQDQPTQHATLVFAIP